MAFCPGAMAIGPYENWRCSVPGGSAAFNWSSIVCDVCSREVVLVMEFVEAVPAPVDLVELHAVAARTTTATRTMAARGCERTFATVLREPRPRGADHHG